MALAVVLAAVAAIAFAASASAAAVTSLRDVPASACMPAASDYTHLWWMNGFRGRTTDGRWIRCIRTGRYAAALDVERMEIVHLGAVTHASTYDGAVEENGDAVTSLPPADLGLTIRVGGVDYRCVRGGPLREHSGPRVVESGRFVQRIDGTDLVFEDARGRKLDVDARLEMVAWPDRLAILLDARPRPGATGAEIAAEWADAEVGVRVALGKRVVEGLARLAPGERWMPDRKLTAYVRLDPASGQRDADGPDLLRVEARDAAHGTPAPVHFDEMRGWYRVDLDGMRPQGAGRDVLERVHVVLGNPGPTDRPVRLLFDKTGAGMHVEGSAVPTGFTPMLRDADGYPTGIAVQLSRNRNNQTGGDLAYQGVWLHGFSLLRLPARSRVTLEFALAYAHWGGVAAASHAQRCPIGWGANQVWDEATIGGWGASICYEPDQVQLEACVTDVRPLMVLGGLSSPAEKWAWTSDVGGGDFFRWFGADGERVHPERVRTEYIRQGPVLTEAVYGGALLDGDVGYRIAASIHRTDDLVRGIYRIRMRVLKEASFHRLVIFQAGADTYGNTGERKMAVGNADRMVREWRTQWGGNRYRTDPVELAGETPWVSMHEGVPRTPGAVWTNRGVVIRNWNARLGGRGARPWAAEYGADARGEATSVVDIVPPPGVHHVEPGDYVDATIELVVMPQFARDYYGPNGALLEALLSGENTWRMVLREAVGNDVAVATSKGSLMGALPVRILAAPDGSAEFALTGGLGYQPVTVVGLSAPRAPLLELQSVDGTWAVVDQSVLGRDFWQTDYDAATRRWEITYTLPLDAPGGERVTRAYRFRLVCDPHPMK